MLAIEDKTAFSALRMKCVLVMFYEELTLDNYHEFSKYHAELFELMRYVLSYGASSKPSKNEPSVLDFGKDFRYIIQAVNKNGGDCRDGYLHFWTFLDRLAVNVNGTFLDSVISIRRKKNKGEKLSKWEKDFVKQNSEII